MENPPQKQRYIIAVDPVVPQQNQVVKAISDALGTGRVKYVPQEDIYLNRELTVKNLKRFLQVGYKHSKFSSQTFQADQILLDLNIESKFCKENFDIEWMAEEGFPSIIQELVQEYREDRNLVVARLDFMFKVKVQVKGLFLFYFSL